MKKIAIVGVLALSTLLLAGCGTTEYPTTTKPVVAPTPAVNDAEVVVDADVETSPADDIVIDNEGDIQVNSGDTVEPTDAEVIAEDEMAADDVLAEGGMAVDAAIDAQAEVDADAQANSGDAA